MSKKIYKDSAEKQRKYRERKQLNPVGRPKSVDIEVWYRYEYTCDWEGKYMECFTNALSREKAQANIKNHYPLRHNIHITSVKRIR